MLNLLILIQKYSQKQARVFRFFYASSKVYGGKLLVGNFWVKPSCSLNILGKDISHWFDEKTGDIQYYIHPETGCRIPYCPHGPIPDVSVQVPSTDWRPLEGKPWWRDDQYQIGLLTKRVRPIRIINMICPFAKEVLINVCCEDTFYRIQERYSMFNSDADSYTWRYHTGFR
nr:unnamed protein product [Callosobruchus analis]